MEEVAVFLDHIPEQGDLTIVLDDGLLTGCFLHGVTSLVIEWPGMIFFQPFAQVSGWALGAVAEKRRSVFTQSVMSFRELFLFSHILFQHSWSPLFFPSPGLAGLACLDNSDGLSHDADIMGDSLCHFCLVLLRDLAQGFMDAAQDFPLLFFAHGITSECYVSIAYRFVSAIDNVA